MKSRLRKKMAKIGLDQINLRAKYMDYDGPINMSKVNQWVKICVRNVRHRSYQRWLRVTFIPKLKREAIEE